MLDAQKSLEGERWGLARLDAANATNAMQSDRRLKSAKRVTQRKLDLA